MGVGLGFPAMGITPEIQPEIANDGWGAATPGWREWSGSGSGRIVGYTEVIQKRGSRPSASGLRRPGIEDVIRRKLRSSLWPRLGFRNYRQFSGIPGGEAAGHLDQVGDPILVQDAGGDGRAVAARTMDGNAAVAGDFGDALLQMVER
jgi:hypothetical protein